MGFTPEIYDVIREGAIRSAAKIVPLVVAALGIPETVIDVGCGEGWFAREFAKLGATVWGFDEAVADGHADGVEFVRMALPGPLPLADLVVCLEVAEHIPAADAVALVDSLCLASPVILFSAAIPGQGGHGHRNEQWPGYWAALFARHGRVASDDLRLAIWDDTEIEPWYCQNLLVFAPADELVRCGLAATVRPLSLVHPTIWEHRREKP